MRDEQHTVSIHLFFYWFAECVHGDRIFGREV